MTILYHYSRTLTSSFFIIILFSSVSNTNCLILTDTPNSSSGHHQTKVNAVEAFACNLGKCSITRAEIRGALEGIRLAWARGFRKVQVQIDSEAAVAILLDSSQTIDHRHAIEVLEFRDWMGKEWELHVRHVYREANKAADYLANLGHSLDRGCHSVPLTDCNLAYCIRHDCMGISNPRLVN
ncbi:Putative ribonuclease H protein At1g65750 [Linum perenne]